MQKEESKNKYMLKSMRKRKKRKEKRKKEKIAHIQKKRNKA
jgi:hypothetical protein